MNSKQLIGADKLSVVELRAGEYWIRIGFWLAHEFTGGDRVRFAGNATVSINGANDVSGSYTRANWTSCVISGALYAFRALGIPRQYLVVTELSGQLRASDMDAVANAAAIGIAQLAHKELQDLPTEG